MKKYIISFCIIIVLILIGIVGLFIYKNINTKTDIENVKAKVNQEIKYLDSNIVSIMNLFHHITYTNYRIVESEMTASSKTEDQQSNQPEGSDTQSGGDSQSGSEKKDSEKSNKVTNIIPSNVLTNINQKVDWDTIKTEVELIYSSWPSILVDLSSLDVNKDNLIKFTDTLNQIIGFVEKEDQKMTIVKLSDLYYLISSYLKDYSDDTMLVTLLSTRSYILKTYALVEYDDKWNEMKKSIASARAEYTKILNDSLNTNNINSINKAYILLNEIEKSIDTHNKNIYYINYKNLMQELDILLE